MNWLEFLASIWKTAAWPATIIVIIVLFRGPISILLKSLRSIKYQNAEVAFGNALERAEETGELLPEPLLATPKSVLPSTTTLGLIDKALSAAEPDRTPEERIKKAWYSVRRAIWRTAQEAAMPDINRLKPMTSSKWLLMNKYIDKNTYETIRDLHDTYDTAKAGQGLIDIGEDRASRYQALSQKILSLLASIPQKS